MSLRRVLIAEDEPLARLSLRKLVESAPEWQVVAECESGREALAAARRHPCDVAILDVRMPQGDGLELARSLRRLSPPPLVVFATAYDRHAVTAFELEAVDYLLKPYSQRRFDEMRRRVEARLAARRRSGEAHTEGEVVIRAVGSTRVVALADVFCALARGNYVELRTTERSYLYRSTLAELTDRLDAGQWLQVHRSAWVHAPSVRELRRDSSRRWTAVLQDGSEAPVSRAHVSALRARLEKR